MPSLGCCARPPASRVLTGRPPAIECVTGFPTQTPRIWLLFDDLLGIADPNILRCPQLIPMRVGGG